MSKQIFSIFFLSLIAGCNITCNTSKKMAAAARVVKAAKKVTASEQINIAGIAAKSATSLKEEKIDSTIYNNIAKKLKEYADSVNALRSPVKFLDSVIATKLLFRKNKDQVKTQVKLIDNYIKDSSFHLRRFALINADLDISKQYLFDLAAFFGPGKYNIPDDKFALSRNAFTPIIDSLVAFYYRYKDVNRIATLIVIGFADGQGFNKASGNFRYLIKLLNDNQASKESVNQKLSELRAKGIADIMELILNTRVQHYTALRGVDFTFLEMGKGEAYPSKKITDYKENDERRRIVMLYWSVLPK